MVNNAVNYDDVDVMRAMFTISSGRLSRQELVRELGLGEGTVRSVLDKLKEKGFIESTQQGHSLSEKGKKEVERLKNLIPKHVKVKIDDVHKDAFCAGVVVHGFNRDKINFTLRDSAVRNGAYGALIFYYNDNLELPGVDKHEFDFLAEEFKLKRGDTLLLVSAENKKTAEKAALRVAIKMADMRLI